MIGRLLVRILNAQSGWAKPFGDFNHRWLSALFGPIKPIKSFLNGTWLGHSVHAALTDVPVGVFTLAILFDLLNLGPAGDIAIVIGILSMLAAAVAGLADYTDVDGHPRTVATVHATLMVFALLAFVVDWWFRQASPNERGVIIVIDLIGYGLLTAGAWVGGENVYAYGDMVYRHAWRFIGTPKWTALDVTDIPEGVPTKAKAGAQTLVLVRTGEQIYALNDVCAHAGGPLSEGKLVDGCIECPWHASRYDMKTGHRKQGPTTFDQPRYDVRKGEGGGWEVKRVESTGQNI